MGALGPVPQGLGVGEAQPKYRGRSGSWPTKDDVSLFKQEAQAYSRFILPGTKAVKKQFVS